MMMKFQLYNHNDHAKIFFSNLTVDPFYVLLEVPNTSFPTIIFNEFKKSWIGHLNLKYVDYCIHKNYCILIQIRYKLACIRTCSGLMPHASHVVFSKYSLAMWIFSSVMYPAMETTSILSNRGVGIQCTTFAVQTNRTYNKISTHDLSIEQV